MSTARSIEIRAYNGPGLRRYRGMSVTILDGISIKYDLRRCIATSSFPPVFAKYMALTREQIPYDCESCSRHISHETRVIRVNAGIVCANYAETKRVVKCATLSFSSNIRDIKALCVMCNANVE